MKKKRHARSIDWKSKVIDLFIVIVGITIAFKLNTWNENANTNAELESYLESFSEENKANINNLNVAIEHAASVMAGMDTLKQILITERFGDERIEPLSISMMGLSNFSPSTTTMENIIASGQFELIRKVALRTDIITTYNSFKEAKQTEALLFDYVDTYLTPSFLENVRFNDPSSIEEAYVRDTKFINMVFGYSILLEQQIKGYESSRERAVQLGKKLETARMN